MKPSEVVGKLIEHSGKSANSLSYQLGRSREYVRNTSTKASPGLATVADVADVCGVDVVLIDRATGAALGTVTPPRREA